MHAATRPSLRPLHLPRARCKQNSGAIAPREDRPMSPHGHCERSEAIQGCLKIESEHLPEVVLANASTHNHRHRLLRAPLSSVMPGLVPSIHVGPHMRNDVDGRDKPGHDELGAAIFSSIIAWGYGSWLFNHRLGLWVLAFAWLSPGRRRASAFATTPPAQPQQTPSDPRRTRAWTCSGRSAPAWSARSRASSGAAGSHSDRPSAWANGSP